MDEKMKYLNLPTEGLVLPRHEGCDCYFAARDENA